MCIHVTTTTAPLYEQRKGVVAPAGLPTENDGVPKFWSTALFNMPMIRDQLTQKDIEVLEFLTDVTCEKLPTDSVWFWCRVCSNAHLPSQGFSITFHFAENPFFTNKTLVRCCVCDRVLDTSPADYPVRDLVRPAA